MGGKRTPGMAVAVAPMPVRSLPGFEHIRRYWDSKHKVNAARILPGEYYVSIADEVISTVLGSCVSACIRDIHSGVGGMNHFMLPKEGNFQAEDEECATLQSRYGSFAMEHMINIILANGSKRENIEIKLFGGGRMMPSMSDVGERNIAFARKYLANEGFQVSGEDMGGPYSRKVLYFSKTGKVLLKKKPMNNNVELARMEADYQRTLEAKPVAGEIDLF
ncbi:MAG: chemoreceptor glutamine deamidase CheD [Halioglobus sp.]